MDTKANYFRMPALQAAFIQCIALLLAITAAQIIHFATGQSISLIATVVAQGTIAAFVSFRLRQATWWHAIQFLFPISLIAAQSLPIHPNIYLGTFAFLMFFYWTTFRTRVPFYPSGSDTWHAVANLLPRAKPLHVLDIGSGLGGLLMHLAKKRPDSRFTGIEVAPLPWLISYLSGRIARNPAHFIRGNYDDLDFSQYDVVFAYLSPAAMPMLWSKAKQEMKPGSMLISYEFVIPEVPAGLTVPVKKDGKSIYCWFF